MTEVATISSRIGRAVFINELLGRPYAAGGEGPDAFDCWGLTRLLQRAVYGRTLPPFFMPREAGRVAIASAIAAHPERERWVVVPHPVDGAIAVMARQNCGYHLGTYLALDGGLVVHTLEESGVVADPPFRLTSIGGGRWRIAWHIPATAEAMAA